MNLKKNLKSKVGQAVVEYIVLFAILAASVLVVFGAFSPEGAGIRSKFDSSINAAIAHINQ